MIWFIVVCMSTTNANHKFCTAPKDLDSQQECEAIGQKLIYNNQDRTHQVRYICMQHGK